MKVRNGITILTYRSGSAHHINDGALHIRFSDDYGETWSDEDKTLAGVAVTGFPMNPSTLSAGEDAGEPWLYLAPNGDLILHMWRVDYGVTANGTYQSVSSDGGATWSASALVDFVGLSAAQDLLTFGTQDDFVYDGVIYAAAWLYTNATPTDSKNIFIKSTDNGATWQYVSDIAATNVAETGLEYVGNNTIVAVIRTLDLTYTRTTISEDMGVTWQALVDITAHFKASGRQRVYTLAHLRGEANWWTDPNLICVGFEQVVPGSSQPRRPAIWLSTDAGISWSGPYYLDVQTEDAGYGDIVYDPNTGKYVNVTYYGELLAASLVQYKFDLQLAA